MSNEFSVELHQLPTAQKDLLNIMFQHVIKWRIVGYVPVLAISLDWVIHNICICPDLIKNLFQYLGNVTALSQRQYCYRIKEDTWHEETETRPGGHSHRIWSSWSMDNPNVTVVLWIIFRFLKGKVSNSG